ncbi:phosphoribosylformylglycinamidine synthase subunit PurQ [Dethiosulfatarculus sandiegensis]|uniref:Phosphoribosylformylglycinamidine synthase n=1 Tax=Dethiosulfatarculus sandiegensis TaxID=1429043 RepID=A0A0D2JMN2_9BACT|nr:phosphoribosylformylglycinamidine synthase subunit PurQ [Dethiosulfatarculus sandiegensis]KIX10745.1 phosphoribosylformylglycinamidine synthase [Dethiosulfatarculus sandiegensis]
MTVRALVLAGYGLNCDVETNHALLLAGAEAEVVHVNDLTGYKGHKPVKTLDQYDILAFVGGFSWGDDHGGGVVLAARLANHLGDQVREFVDQGGLAIGICNGFQVLVNLGLLPGLKGQTERSVALIANNCGNFQDRWVEMLAEPKSPCVFTRGLSRFDLPIRHGEGKFVATDETLARLEENGLVALRYGDGRGDRANGEFPQNPNGSKNDIAGICDQTGRIFGLMPHPEGFYRQSQHPLWTRLREEKTRKGEPFDSMAPAAGLKFFQNAVEAVKQEKAK